MKKQRRGLDRHNVLHTLSSVAFKQNNKTPKITLLTLWKKCLNKVRGMKRIGKLNTENQFFGHHYLILYHDFAAFPLIFGVH